MDAREATEKLQPIRDEFLLRFYRWSAEFSRQEFEKNFPIIRQINNPSVVKLISFVRSLGRAEKLLLCSALLKRSHKRAVELLKDFPSTQEESLLERCLEVQRAYVPEIDNERYKAIIRRPSKAPLPQILLSKLGPVLGKVEMIGGSRQVWAYSLSMRCWTVKTWIDTGGRRSLGYSHSIDAQPAVALDTNISMLVWMGITQTDWFDLSEDEYSEAADSLARVCTYFLDAAPKLLDGLSHELPESEVRGWRESVTVKGHRQNGMTIVTIDTPELRSAFRGKATWDIPTSVIPERLRAVGSHFVIVQDPAFSRESTDPLAVSSTYRHVRVEVLKRSGG
jgi:hypothetical protein